MLKIEAIYIPSGALSLLLVVVVDDAEALNSYFLYLLTLI